MVETKTSKRMAKVASVVLLAAVTLLGLYVSAVPSSYSAKVHQSDGFVNPNGKNMMNTIKALCSAKYAGRLAGTSGNELAAQYISEQFKKMGLENPRGMHNYSYPYYQPVVEIKSAPVLQLINSKGQMTSKFNYPKNFVLRRVSDDGDRLTLTGQMVVMDDLSMLYKKDGRLKNKIILLPWKYYNQLGSQNQPDDFAQVTGALAVISEFDLERNKLGYSELKVRPLCRSADMPKAYKPFAYVDSATFKKLVLAAHVGDKLNLTCVTHTEALKEVSNCVGLIEGREPEADKGSIIIGAHFDHVGGNGNGTWNPGAFDNASGTAVMLEVARVLGEQKVKPKKTILFMAFNGEESGLNGSWSYCQGPAYPLKNAVMINLDMVGGSANQRLTIAVASKTSDPSLSNSLVKVAKKIGIKTGTMVENGSDHTSFDSHGVPSVCLLNDDLSRGYHSPYDTITQVRGDRLEEAAQLVLAYIRDNAY